MSTGSYGPENRLQLAFWPSPGYNGRMERVEVQRIAQFLSDVQEGICEGDGTTTMQQQLTELYRVIKLLMDEAFQDQDLEPIRITLSNGTQ
jgi:hypothetical protein